MLNEFWNQQKIHGGIAVLQPLNSQLVTNLLGIFRISCRLKSYVTTVLETDPIYPSTLFFVDTLP